MKRGRKALSTGASTRKSTYNVETFKRLTKGILTQMLDRTTSKPLADYYTAAVHFNALELYCNSVPKENWKNLFLMDFDLINGKSNYRRYILDALPKTRNYDSNIIKSNSKSLVNTWFSGKMVTFLKERKKFEIPIVPSNVDDRFRFLLLTIGFIVKHYALQYAGRKISRQKRREDLGEDIELAYTEAKRQLPNLWKLKLLDNDDFTEDVFEYSDEEGDEMPREKPKISVSESPLSPNDYYLNVLLKTVTEEVQTRKKKLKYIKAEIKDVQSKHGDLNSQYDKLQFERENIRIIQKNLQQRDKFVSYCHAIPEDFFPGQNRGEDMIKLVSPLVALKSLIVQKNIPQSPSTLLSAWIDSLREKNKEALEEEVATQLQYGMEKGNMEENCFSIDTQPFSKRIMKRKKKLSSKSDITQTLFTPDIIKSVIPQTFQSPQVYQSDNCNDIFSELDNFKETLQSDSGNERISHVLNNQIEEFEAVEEYNPLHPDMSPGNLNDTII